MLPGNLISRLANGHRNVGSKAVGQRSQNDLLEQAGPAVCKNDDAMANTGILNVFATCRLLHQINFQSAGATAAPASVIGAVARAFPVARECDSHMITNPCNQNKCQISP